MIKKTLKTLIKSVISEEMVLKYHSFQSVLACAYYRNPSKKLKVIGITGTKGKSTAANFVWSVLQNNGKETGLVGTANIRIGIKEFANTSHMTMPGAWEMQKRFADMVKHDCEFAVIEVTSEGIKQHRNDSIHFFTGMFTNLSPEHLPSHNNSFEEYKNTKKKFFTQLSLQKAPLIIVNGDSEFTSEFLEEDILEKRIVSLQNNSGKFNTQNHQNNINAEIVSIGAEKTLFRVNDFEYSLHIGGDKNVENALLAVSIGEYLGFSPVDIQKGFSYLETIAGRMERIDEGQNFTVFVDYAHEEKSMTFISETAEQAVQENIAQGKPSKSIVLLGAEGGGRDPRKRAIMGKIVGEKIDIVIVSNVDPYEDDPTPICEDIAKACETTGKKRNENLFVIEDRREGIAKAFEKAKENDIIFITGKGSEQTITIGGKSIPWDDRTVVREELKKI